MPDPFGREGGDRMWLIRTQRVQAARQAPPSDAPIVEVDP